MTWESERPRLYAHTVETDPAALGELAALVPAVDGFAWLRDGDGMVGSGELVRHKSSDVAEARQWWGEQVATAVVTTDLGTSLGPVPGSGLMAFGSFVFDPDNTAAQSVLIVPRTVVGRRNGRAWVTTIANEPVATPAAVWAPAVPSRPAAVEFDDAPLDADGWTAAVAEAVRRIGTAAPDGRPAGLQKVVLARGVSARAAEPIDPRWLVARLAVDYRRCWTYLVDGTVGATPEMLVRREQGLATSRVLAGTIRRTRPETGDAHDRALATVLAGSDKDLQEHSYAVTSVARALAPLCSGMNVPDAPYVLQLPNVLHLATDVTAVADPAATSLDLAAALHPSAAVCGTPTDLARATIAELERLDRQRYAGPVGWVDAAGDGEWAIALRGGQLDPLDPTRIHLFAGCGIVAGSDPAAELAEADAKLVPMRSALTG